MGKQKSTLVIYPAHWLRCYAGSEDKPGAIVAGTFTSNKAEEKGT